MDAKKILLEILDYYRYKVENNLCSITEMDGAIKAMENNMELYGTIGDFAKFYNVPETTVRTNISRKLFDKPVRKVLYPFHKFMKIVPDKWLNKK